MEPETKLRVVAGTLFVFMVLQIGVGLVWHATLESWMSARRFAFLGAAILFVLLVGLLAVRGYDAVNVAVASMVVPWTVFVLMNVIGLGGVDWSGFYYLFWDLQDLFVFCGAYVLAGLGALAVHEGADRLFDRRSAVTR